MYEEIIVFMDANCINNGFCAEGSGITGSYRTGL